LSQDELLRLEREYDENLTFQPVINKNLPNYLTVDGNQSVRGSKFEMTRMSVMSSNSALRKPRSQIRGEDTRASMVSSSVDSDSGLVKSKTLKASEKLLGEKLEKEIKMAILEVMKVD